MSYTTSGFVLGVLVTVIAGIVMAGFGGAGVAILMPFGAVLLGGLGALPGGSSTVRFNLPNACAALMELAACRYR